jgi:hypothetical protein
LKGLSESFPGIGKAARRSGERLRAKQAQARLRRFGSEEKHMVKKKKR